MRTIIIFTAFLTLLAATLTVTPVSACPVGTHPCGGACCPN